MAVVHNDMHTREQFLQLTVDLGLHFVCFFSVLISAILFLGCLLLLY